MRISQTRLKAIHKLEKAVHVLRLLAKNGVSVDAGLYDKWCMWDFIRYAHFAVSARGWTAREQHLISKFVKPGPGGAPIPRWEDENTRPYDDKRIFADYAAAVSILCWFVAGGMEQMILPEAAEIVEARIAAERNGEVH